MPKQLLYHVHLIQYYCTVVRICPPTDSVVFRTCRLVLSSSSWPIAELYYRQIRSEDSRNRFYLVVDTGPEYPVRCSWQIFIISRGPRARLRNHFSLSQLRRFKCVQILLYTYTEETPRARSRFSLSVEKEQADAERDGRICLARSDS